MVCYEFKTLLVRHVSCHLSHDLSPVCFVFICVAIIYCRVSVTIFTMRVIQSESDQDIIIPKVLLIPKFLFNFRLVLPFPHICSNAVLWFLCISHRSFASYISSHPPHSLSKPIFPLQFFWLLSMVTSAFLSTLHIVNSLNLGCCFSIMFMTVFPL